MSARTVDLAGPKEILGVDNAHVSTGTGRHHTQRLRSEPGPPYASAMPPLCACSSQLSLILSISQYFSVLRVSMSTGIHEYGYP